MLYTTITDDKSVRQNFAKDPAVIKLNGKYFLYHSVCIYEDEKEKFAVGIATSQDLETWEYQGYIPLSESYERNGVAAPGAFVENGIVHLFYQTYGNWTKDAICHATSKNGVDFDRNPTNPIFAPTNDWCCGRAIDADVVAFKDKLFLYFATRDHEMRVQKQGVAVAPLGSNYEKPNWTQVKNGTILCPEFVWEGECIEAAATIVHEDKVYLFYGGAYNCKPQQIGCAVSENGVDFVKIFNEPFLACGKKGDWNESESGHPYVFEDEDGKVYLFYQGSPDMGNSWYLSKCQIDFKDGKPYIVNE